MPAVRINTDGTKQPVAPKNGKTFKLDELQGIVGGYIEILRLADGRLMVLNEEGKLKGLPYNGEATMLAIQAGLVAWDHIVGDVLVCDND